MNRKFLITIACAIAAGAGSAYVTMSLAENKASTKIVEITSGNKSSDYSFASTPQKGGTGFPDMTQAAENTVKGVVNIEKIELIESQNQYYGGDYNPFFEFFGVPQGSRQGQGQGQQKPQERRSGGSGVIISKDGYIITNNHVSENANKIKVTMSDGRSFDAKLIGADPTTDIALLKIEAKEDLPVIPFGSSDDLKLGEWVLAVGNPYGLNSTVTAGIVSAKGRNLDVIPSQFRIESFIQTDAAVNPGNSGGALVNTKGELIGINTVIKSPTGSYAGYSFAVPSSIVQKVIGDLIEYGVVQRAMLGVEYKEVTDEIVENSKGKITEKEGLYVAKVSGAAADAGIKPEDIIFEVDGVKVTTSSQLQEIMAKHRPNEKVNISVKRDGSVKHFEVLLRNKAGEAKLLDKNSVDVPSVLGGQYANLSDRTKKSLNIKSGIQVVDVGSGLLKKSQIKNGYIITHINGIEIKDVSDLSKITSNITIIDGLYPNGKYISYAVVN